MNIFQALFEHQKNLNAAQETFGSGNPKANGNAVDKAAESGEVVINALSSGFKKLSGITILALAAMLVIEQCGPSAQQNPNNKGQTETPYQQPDAQGNEEPDIRIEDYE